MVEREFIRDSSGELEVTEFGAFFHSARYFIVRTSSDVSRGFHAHRVCAQALFSLRGRIQIDAKSRSEAASVTLTSDGPGVLIPPMVWAEQHYLDDDGGTLLVLASHNYDGEDYIRDFDAFQRESDQVI